MNRTKIALQDQSASLLLRGHGVLQRQCDCGNHITASEKCCSCDKGQSTTNAATVQRQEGDVAAENRTGMPSPLKAGLETLSGMDLSGVRVYRNSAKPSQVDALAYTQGQNIYVGPGQEKYLPHEGWHTVQQMQGRVQPTIQAKGVSINDEVGLEREADVMGEKAAVHQPSRSIESGSIDLQNEYCTTNNLIQREPVYHLVRVLADSFIHSTPSGNDFIYSNSVQANPPRIYFQNLEEVSLLATSGDWIRVRGDAYRESGSITVVPGREAGVPVGETTGWIRRSSTTIAASSNATTENDRVAQDLDDLLDAHILPSLDSWEEGLRIQGNAYLTAYNHFSGTLTRASQQAKARADFYAAVLTAVSAGALGWIGESVNAGNSLSRLLSEANRGSLEDALQTGVGEAIDIAQGGWFTQHVSNETHPLRYLNTNMIHLVGLKRELRQHMGEAKLRIRRSATAVDRAGVLTEMYQYWSDARARDTPKSMASDEATMAVELERGFWQKYILEDLTVLHIAARDNLRGRIGHRYTHPEDAVELSLDRVEISQMAGISSWDSWYQGTHWSTGETRDEPNPEGGIMTAHGSTWTQTLAHWARNYTPVTFD